MKVAAAFFGLLSGFLGLVAAVYWFRASAITPTNTIETPTGLAGQSWTAGILKAMKESARLNKLASIWTAGAVIAAAIASALGALSN